MMNRGNIEFKMVLCAMVSMTRRLGAWVWVSRFRCLLKQHGATL